MDTHTKSVAYMSGYMQKQAINLFTGAVDTAGRMAGSLSEEAVTLLAVAPILLGVASAYTASKITSPSGDSELLQKRMVTNELEEAVAAMRRRQALQGGTSKAKAPQDARSLRLL